MRPVSATIRLCGVSSELIEEFRSQIESAIRRLPVTLQSLTSTQGNVQVEVEYDGDDQALDEQILQRVLDAVDSTIPADRLNSDPSFDDPELGMFVWDSTSWEGECDVAALEEPLVVRFVTEDSELPTDELLERAKRTLQDFTLYEQQWNEIAVRELFKNFNSNWNTGEPLSIDEFRSELSISSVSFGANGWITAYYFAGDLFREHDVEISIGPAGQERAGLIG